MMIRIFYLFIVAVLLLILKVQGDENVTFPIFPRQAEFIYEHIVTIGEYQRTWREIIFDYDNNRLIMINDHTFDYYNYTILKKSIYSKGHSKQCNVYPIDIDNPLDGFSALTDPDDSTTHIRPLQDILGFPSNAIHLSETILRGYINVQQWIAPLTNDTETIWSFARSDYPMPWNSESYSIPIQSITKRKEDGLILEVLNIFNYKPIITRSTFTPPGGIFCENLIPADDLLSLQDIGINFPNKFSVRIDASSSSQLLWHSVHLRYRLSNERKLIRYDYTPFDNTQNPMTIILDDFEGAPRSYKIDRRTGSCIINETVEITLMTSILHDPIGVLIKHADLLLTNPPHRLFQSTGSRPCRGSILCSIFVGQMSLFPKDPQEDWLKTDIEWGWSKRNIDDENAPYDYPVYMNLNLHRKTSGTPANVHYEFYDYDTDVHINEFDVNLCYRSNQLWYHHLAFQLKIINQPSTDGIENILFNRRRLTEYIRERMISIMSIKYLRISQLEIDHHPNQSGHNETIYCIFTLLDRTPYVDPNTETEVLDAKEKLRDSINQGQFRFTTDDELSLEAVAGSLEDVQYFYVFNPNATNNQSHSFGNTTVHVNRTIIETVEKIIEKVQYSDGAQAGAVVGGMVVGILAGILIVFLVIYMMKQKANMSPTGGLTFRNISFRMRNNNQTEEEQETVTMEHPIHS